MSENDVVFQCCVYLNSNGWFAWRNNTTGVYDEKAGAFRKPPAFCINGVSDIIAIRDGRVLFLECKAGRGTQSDAQLLFEAQCKKHGVDYVVVWSLGELKEWVGRRKTSGGPCGSI